MQCLWQNLSNKIQARRHTTCSEHMCHDAAYKTTTKPYTNVKAASTVYRADGMILRTDIIKSEIMNIMQVRRHDVYA